MSQEELPVALEALRALARRASVARRLEQDAEQRLLQSIVDATVILFEAEASSIALLEKDPERLEFRVAAGAQGAGAIGISVAPSQGIAGFVFSTGQPLALSDVASDPRFDRKTAERTGYVPRSIAAVPLLDRRASVGVLQVLDKRTSPTFTLRDMELLSVFAAQAAAAINATRVQRDLGRLMADVLRQVVGEELSETQVDALVSAATEGLDRDADAPFWAVVEQVRRLETMGEREQRLVADILEVVARHAAPVRAR